MYLLTTYFAQNNVWIGYLFVTMALISVVKGQIHYIVWQYGEDQFRKRYLAHYFVYWIIASIVLIFVQVDIFYIYLGLLGIVVLDCLIFFVKDYSHMHEAKLFISFLVSTLFVSILLIEFTMLFFRMYLALIL